MSWLVVLLTLGGIGEPATVGATAAGTPPMTVCDVCPHCCRRHCCGGPQHQWASQCQALVQPPSLGEPYQHPKYHPLPTQPAFMPRDDRSGPCVAPMAEPSLPPPARIELALPPAEELPPPKASSLRTSDRVAAGGAGKSWIFPLRPTEPAALPTRIAQEPTARRLR